MAVPKNIEWMNSPYPKILMHMLHQYKISSNIVQYSQGYDHDSWRQQHSWDQHQRQQLAQPTQLGKSHKPHTARWSLWCAMTHWAVPRVHNTALLHLPHTVKHGVLTVYIYIYCIILTTLQYSISMTIFHHCCWLRLWPFTWEHNNQ